MTQCEQLQQQVTMLNIMAQNIIDNIPNVCGVPGPENPNYTACRDQQMSQALYYINLANNYLFIMQQLGC